MPINLLGSQYTAPDTFAFMGNPSLQWMSMKDFTARTGSTSMTDYWAAHDAFIAQRLVDVRKVKWNGSPFNFTLERPENNLYNNRHAWDAMSEIFNNGGNILAFDTETIGDFIGDLDSDAAKYAGITEIGFATQHHQGIVSKNFNGTRGITDPQGSFFFGIDSEQKKWLESVLQKKVNGQTLTSTEQSAMERASRHSTLGEHAFSTYKGTWNGQEYTFVKQLNESRPDSILDIQSGIEAMSKRYTANRDEQIAGLISHIDSFTKGGKNRVVVGQNLAYDTGVFNRYAQMHHIQGLSDSFEYADSMFALRSWASQQNTTVAEIVKGVNPSVTNDRLGSLEALTEAITSSTGYTQSLAHNAYEDSLATLRVFEHFNTTNNGVMDRTHLNVVGRALDVLQHIQSEPNTLTLADSLVKINSKGNIRSQDILVMDGQVTTGYQVSNQYWQFDGVGNSDYTGIEWNGKTIIDSSNKYLARFQSANGDGATLFKAFNDEADFRAWLSNNTSLVSKSEADIALQTTIHDRDIARRVIDGFFDPSQVSQYGSGIDAGGFAGFQQYYQMYRDLASLSEDAITSMQLSDAAGNQIRTASELLSNINTGDNIAGIIDYADKHNLSSITSRFRTSAASQVDRMTAHQAGIKYYDQRKIMQQVFDMFGNNEEFFAFANQEISALDNNMARTIAFNGMRQDYLASGIGQLNLPTGYTIDDLNSVSVDTGIGSFAKIDVDDIDRGSRQLLRTFSDNKLANAQVADRLLDVAEQLNTRGLIDKDGLSIIKATHGASNQPYAVAQSIVAQMHQQTESVRNLGATTVGNIRDQLAAGDSHEDIIARYAISEETLKTLSAKDHGTLLDSATSQIGIATGQLSDQVKERAKVNIDYLQGTVLIKDNFDKLPNSTVDNFDPIRQTLQLMNYDAESIEQFKGIYFTNGKGKSNIANFNKNIGEGQQEVRSLFFRSQRDEASAFAVFTTDRQYSKVVDALAQLPENVSNKEVKEALDGIAGYFEIPYLETFDLGENDTIRKLSGGVKDAKGEWQGGHGARAVFVKQGDDFYRYDTFSFNMYEKNGVLTGGIKDQGGSYLTSIRQRAELAYSAVSTEDFRRANAAFNNPNISRMTEEAAPQISGMYDLRGEIAKRHSVSIKDVEYAHTIALDPGEGNLGLLDLMKRLTSDQGYTAANSSSVQAENAIRGIYKAFGDEYNLTFKKDKLFEANAIDRVYDSEPFKHFYQRYLTSQTGGIGSDRNIIAGIINGSNTHGLLDEEVSAIKALQNDSLLQILAKASNDNQYITKDLSNTLNILAYEAGLDAVGSESFAHKMMMHIGGFNPGMMNNSGSSGLIRPTYTQRGNYRSYRLDEYFFTDAEGMSRRLGIKFGDAYTTQQYIDFISKLDEQSLSKVGEAVTSQNVSRRNIIGAVQSISDTEIRAGRDEALQYIRANAGNLDQAALEKIYDRMINDINTYEGKAYVRPSVANQEFFALGDPKNIRSAEIRSVFELGTEAERKETTGILAGLIDKPLQNGTVIGRRLDANGKFQDITYRGQTVQKFTRQNAIELANTGKTQALVERQLEGFKIMFGEEKATAETLAYYMSTNPEQKAAEVKATLESFGLTAQADMQANIRTLDEYTDLVMDAITRSNQTNFKTIVIGNNNVAKHLSDTAIDSRWNIIAMSFAKDGRGELLDFTKRVKVGDGTLFDHIGYNALYDTLTFNDPSDNGAINALDALVDELRNSDSTLAKKAVGTIDLFEQNNIALQSIQRQQMNTFQGQAFKMDQRLYQALVMQDHGNYTQGNGAKLAELIRSNIQNGTYDKNIAKLGLDNIDSTWSDIVTYSRGILSPKFESQMLLGTLDVMDYINGKLDINAKNMIQVDASDLLSRLPKGAGLEGYSNFIFKVNGEDTDYIKSLSKLGRNSAITEFNSNSFYLDLSKYGKFEFNGQKGLTGIVLPYQIINTANEEMFLGESTSATIQFFRTIQGLQGTNNGEEIQKALTDLFKAYSKELSTADKQSLITKALYKMNMPNSSGALAKDAIVPTAPMSIYDIRRIRSLEYDLSRSFDSDKVKELSAALAKRKSDIANMQEKILSAKETDDVVSLLGLTSGNSRYAQYLRHYDDNGNLVGNVIESAITTSKQMFKDTEMDTGRIGWQIVKDYFDQGGHIKSYDGFSKITQKEFEFSAEEFSSIFFGPKGQEFNSNLSALMRTFENTDHRQWAERTSSALYDILYAPNLRYQTEFARQQAIINTFNEEVNRYLPTLKVRTAADVAGRYGTNALASSEYQREFLSQVNSLFEGIGDRYATEVGVLGLTGRYPFFNETGVLPVRIYLDEAVRGKEVRFLGPQFSILQNLDFDGDNEFIKFLGNGGLLAKDALEDSEYNLMKNQFDMMNRHNVNIFAESIKDSVKEYRYGDEASFKASLLKDLDKASYDVAESRFLSALSAEDLALITSEGNEEIKDLLIAHSKPMKDLFADFDLRMGKSINNPDMIKAAIQARLAKEYIGNYSKPNLEIRNAMTYMMSLADEDELKTLRSIREVLFTFDKEPGGLLTLLEQKGIDTKHVHDAATLNNSSAWRVGVTKLFKNANGADNIDQKKIQQAMTDLVEGARKVFFSESEQSNLEIAQDIMSKSFEYWHDVDHTSDINLGKYYLSGLYELSKRPNAYQGFHGLFRTKNFSDILSGIQDMSPDELAQLSQGMYTLDYPVIKTLMSGGFLNKNKTDDLFTMFGRAVREGDIFAYEGTDGPIGVVFKGFDTKKHTVLANTYDFVTGLEGGPVTDWGGPTVNGNGTNLMTSIRDLNEHTKRYGNRSLLNLNDPNTPERNLNINAITQANQRETVQRRIGALYTEHNLQWFFDNVDSADFNTRFFENINANMIVPGYDGHTSLGKTFANIVGDDVDAFKRRVIDISERLQYGVEHGMIAGSNDAKELIRAINKEIANNPRKSVHLITGASAVETVRAYIGSDNIINDEFLQRSLDEVRLSNQISAEIDARIAQRDARINELATTFYNDVTKKGVAEETAFKSTRETWEKEVTGAANDVFTSIRKSTNPKDELMYRFGWNGLGNSDFIIDLNNDTIRTKSLSLSNARIGYGNYIGVKVSDLTQAQLSAARKEIDAVMPDLARRNLSDLTLEELAIINTKEILSQKGLTGNIDTALDFATSDTLMASYKAVFNPEAGQRFAEEVGEDAIKAAKEAAAKASREASEGIQKKTLLKEIGESFKNISPETGKRLKIGGAIAGGAAVLGLVGHALFTKQDNDSVEVPDSVERQLTSQDVKGVKINNKNGLQYRNQASDAQTTQRSHKKIAPPSIPSALKNRTIYHDAASGFNFKVSAQSYNKLQAQSYQRMMNQSGVNNGQVNITRDNSKITDNWLENKFAQLTE